MKSNHYQHPWAHRRKGFTLMEIIIAIFILGVVVSMVLASFDGVFTDADHINAASDIFELANAALDRLSADLKALHTMTYPRYIPPDIDDDPDIYRLKGEVRSVSGESFGWLRFTSLAHLAFNQEATEGIAEIIYYVQETPEGQFILRRADKLFPYPDEFEESDKDPVVCEQVRKFQLTYYDHEGRELEEWDSEAEDYEYATPRAIGIALNIGTEASNFDFGTRIALPVYRFKELGR